MAARRPARQDRDFGRICVPAKESANSSVAGAIGVIAINPGVDIHWGNLHLDLGDA